MKQALKDYKIVGLNNNLKFLKRVFDDNIFQQGEYDTGFIEQNIETLLKKEERFDPFDAVSAIVAREVVHAKTLPIPKELIGFRNVKGLK